MNKTTQDWITSKDAHLNKTQLKEGQVYLLPFLSKNGTVLVNHCLYAVIKGEVVIHRSANWEDVPHSNLTKEAFLKGKDLTIEKIPENLICFLDLNKSLQ